MRFPISCGHSHQKLVIYLGIYLAVTSFGKPADPPGAVLEASTNLHIRGKEGGREQGYFVPSQPIIPLYELDKRTGFPRVDLMTFSPVTRDKSHRNSEHKRKRNHLLMI